MRLFVAVDIDESTRSMLTRLLAELEESELSRSGSVRWVKPASLHVTMKFIGEQPEARLPAIREALSQVPTPDPFGLKFRGVGCFPNERRPRVFWVGIEAPAELGFLAQRIESALEPLGIEREKRQFSPHLTLGRMRENTDPRIAGPQIWTALEPNRNALFGTHTASEFWLYQSKLSRGGSEYTRLESFPLTGSARDEQERL